MKEVYSCLKITEDTQEKIEKYFALCILVVVVGSLLFAFWFPICVIANCIWEYIQQAMHENREIFSKPLSQLTMKDIFHVLFTCGMGAFLWTCITGCWDEYKEDWFEEESL